MITEIKSADGYYKLTGKTYWPLFGREVRVRWGDYADVSTEYAEKCVSQLLNLDQSSIEQLLKASIRFFIMRKDVMENHSHLCLSLRIWNIQKS